MSCWNHFPRVTEQICSGSGLSLDFSKGSVGSSLTDFFAEHGLIEMFETSDYESIDQASPYLGAITDRMYGNECNLEITMILKRYVELLGFVRRKNTSPH